MSVHPRLGLAICFAVPPAFERFVDRAIRVYGAKGVSTDKPLEGMSWHFGT